MIGGMKAHQIGSVTESIVSIQYEALLKYASKG
ncbi:hypothetical protein CAP2UW1_2464 [Candidatus Accumulibacter phosphatis]|jgi:hypothetical protein|uniref:Uncharacterized protein n=1 Tax=Accumulibacter regalis TaxID=522306 RepID=C7RR71_ACCRE